KIVKWLDKNGHIVEEKDHDIDGIRLMKDYYLMNSGEVSMVMQQLERTMGRTITRDDVEIETYLLHVEGQSVSAAEYSASLASWDTAAEKRSEERRVGNATKTGRRQRQM